MKVKKAIRDCLRRCCRSNDMVDELAKCLTELQSAEGWGRAERHAVEVAVSKILQRVVAA